MEHVKHTKFKNTSILFELLTKQLTADVLNNVDNPKSLKLIKKYFNVNTELGKENQLYQQLINTKFVNEDKAKEFVDVVVKVHQRLNVGNLNRLKYNLIKEIKNIYQDTFFKSNINNYKVHASIYKLFKFDSLMESMNVSDVIDSKTCVMNCLMNRIDSDGVILGFDKIIENYKNQPADIRVMAYKLLVNKFNDKYKNNLDENQSKLLKIYINKESILPTFIFEESNRLEKELIKGIKGVKNDVAKIKLQEIIKLLKTLKSVKVIKETHVSALLKFYELLKEVNILCKKIN